MKPSNPLALLDEYLQVAVTTLLCEWGCAEVELAPCDPREEWPDAVMATIGFTSEHARGSIGLVMQPPVAKFLAAPSEDLPASDVVGEFCNMVLGRLKNRLYARRVVLQMALPALGAGTNVRIAPNSAGRSVWHQVSTPAGPIVVRLEATFDPGFTVAAEDARDADAIGREGDCFIF